VNNENPMVDKKPTIQEIVDEAVIAASSATAKYLRENPDNWYPCGFAWVKIKPARGKLVTYLKDTGIGNVSMMGGLDVWNPSGNCTQSMYAKVEGAKAFAAVLKKHGYNAVHESRID